MTFDPAKNKVSPQLLDELQKYEYDKKYHKWQSHYDGTGFKSYADRSRDLMNEIYAPLGSALKRMHAEFLGEVAENCYDDRHMQDEWANLPQIKHCKEEVRYRIMGSYLRNLQLHRDSDSIKFRQCVDGTKNDFKEGVACIEQLMSDIGQSNERIVSLFRRDYPQYL